MRYMIVILMAALFSTPAAGELAASKDEAPVCLTADEAIANVANAERAGRAVRFAGPSLEFMKPFFGVAGFDVSELVIFQGAPRTPRDMVAAFIDDCLVGFTAFPSAFVDAVIQRLVDSLTVEEAL